MISVMDMQDNNASSDVESFKKKLSSALLWRLSKSQEQDHDFRCTWRWTPEIAVVKCLPTSSKKLKKHSFSVMLAVHRIENEAGTLSAIYALQGNQSSSVWPKKDCLDEIYVDASDDLSLKSQMEGKVWVPLLEASCSMHTLEKLADAFDSKVFSRKDHMLVAEEMVIARDGDSFEKIFVEMDLASDAQNSQGKNNDEV